jgi:pimeloyl-ACP methyl ester carboxylesterase
MEPLFFGSNERRLYGVHHPARKAGSHAILLCYPGPQEYNAAHWAFRRLASMLARDGHHVLRFDYFGTGDSGGQCTDASPESALADIKEAIRELQDLSGARSVSLLGMRLGATFAALASAAGSRLRRLILWEPVVSGQTYVKELELSDARRNLALLHAARTRGRRDELLGHAFPEQLRSATEALDLTRSVSPRSEKAAIFVSEPGPDHLALKEALEKANVPTIIHTSKDEGAGSGETRERTLLSNTVLVDMAKELKELGA